MMGNTALWAAMQEKETLLAGEITDEIGLHLGELEGTIAEENGYMAESEAAELLAGVGIPPEKHEQPMATLAAGYKLRVLLAQVLFGKPDVLLLDEPTNHLDLESISWLENFLINYPGLVVIISHDRHFLNEAATHIADVDYRTITVYTGNYNDFVDAKYENRQRAEQQSAVAKKKMGELQEFVQRFGSHASKSKQAQSRVKQIEKLSEEIQTKGPKRSSLVRPFVRFPFEKPSGRDVARMEGANKRFGDHVVFDNANLNINRGDRIAVLGPNGVGKSTLLKLLVGSYAKLDDDTKRYVLMPDSGDVRWGHDTSVGYFAQDHHEAIGETGKGLNAYEWLYSFYDGLDKETVRGAMGKMLFTGDEALKNTATLSGGEAARLLLAKMMLGQHNVLILDEPTNHLDIESIEGLLDGLLDFKGTVIFVSHDRHVVGRLATRIIELDRKPGKGCTFDDFGGTYDEFLEVAHRRASKKA